MAGEDDKPGDDPEKPEEAPEEEKAADEPKRPSSPWPSEHPPAAKAASEEKADAEDAEDSGAKSSPPLAPPAVAEPAKKAWGAPLDRLDRVWTKLEARLCAFVLLLMISTLVFWIAIKALSSTGRDGYGQLFRSMLTALVVGIVVHLATRKQKEVVHHVASTAAAVAGWILGKYWGDWGTEYFA